jgi:uncharacterized protein (DUF1778 family)
MRAIEHGQRPVYTMRLATSERRLIELAAAQKSEPLAAYIRRVALLAARQELASDGGQVA